MYFMLQTSQELYICVTFETFICKRKALHELHKFLKKMSYLWCVRIYKLDLIFCFFCLSGLTSLSLCGTCVSLVLMVLKALLMAFLERDCHGNTSLLVLV